MRKLFILFTLLSNILCAATLSGKNIVTQENVSINSKTKKGLVLVFLSARCPCSNSHIPELKLLAQDYPDFNFIGVHSNADETLDEAQTYFKHENLAFPVIQDIKNQLADEYKAFKTPHAFIIDAEGKILYQGGVSSSRTLAHADRKFLREALNDLHNKRTVKIAEGRTLGCTIARAKH